MHAIPSDASLVTGLPHLTVWSSDQSDACSPPSRLSVGRLCSMKVSSIPCLVVTEHLSERNHPADVFAYITCGQWPEARSAIAV